MKLLELITPQDLIDAGVGRTKGMPTNISDEQMIAYFKENVEYIAALKLLAELNDLGDIEVSIFITLYQLIDSAIQQAAERKQRTGV